MIFKVLTYMSPKRGEAVFMLASKPLHGTSSLNIFEQPVAGPGKAWSALEQGEYLFQLAERKPSFIKVPVALMDGIIGFLDFLARIFPGLEVRCMSIM